MAARAAANRSADINIDQPSDRGADIEGPALGRPLDDTIKGSALPNLKELRSASTGASEVRLLFVFDPQRQAVILVGGDKAGNWRGWYREGVTGLVELW